MYGVQLLAIEILFTLQLYNRLKKDGEEGQGREMLEKESHKMNLTCRRVKCY